MKYRAHFFILILMLLANVNSIFAKEYSSVGIAMHGKPKYKDNFTSFDYVNTGAPKGGLVKYASLGNGFNDFNSFNVRGDSPSGIGMIYDSLMKSSSDEAFSEYGLIAEKIEWDDSRTWVGFKLRIDAKFSDGKKITADDVIFSFNTFLKYGNPMYRSYYGDVDKVYKKGDYYVRFDFKKSNPELPLILGQLTIIPKHYWKGRDFNTTTLDVPVGSGPYKVGRFDHAKYIEYERNENYWAKDLPVNVGFNNFDKIRYDFYRDGVVELEAFKAGEYDLRGEYTAKRWAKSYDFPARNEGKVVLKEFKHSKPSGMQGFVYNTRRKVFKDKRVRKALAYAFDFEWSNDKLFFGQYKRTMSYFDNSQLSCLAGSKSGLPVGGELSILNKYKKDLSADVFNKVYEVPVVKGEYGLRDNLKKGLSLLMKAGWSVDEKIKMLKNENGEFLEFEILLNSATFSRWERVVLPFIKNLKRMGVNAKIRTMEVNQYQSMIEDFNFDMVVSSFGQSLSPGNEQAYYWSSKMADVPRSGNIMGIKDSVVDDLIDGVINAKSRKELVFYTRALDRVLLNGYYVIPNWYLPYDRIAYWDKFGYPKTTPMQGVDINTWWIK